MTSLAQMASEIDRVGESARAVLDDVRGARKELEGIGAAAEESVDRARSARESIERDVSGAERAIGRLDGQFDRVLQRIGEVTGNDVGLGWFAEAAKAGALSAQDLSRFLTGMQVDLGDTVQSVNKFFSERLPQWKQELGALVIDIQSGAVAIDDVADKLRDRGGFINEELAKYIDLLTKGEASADLVLQQLDQLRKKSRDVGGDLNGLLDALEQLLQRSRDGGAGLEELIRDGLGDGRI